MLFEAFAHFGEISFLWCIHTCTLLRRCCLLLFAMDFALHWPQHAQAMTRWVLCLRRSLAFSRSIPMPATPLVAQLTTAICEMSPSTHRTSGACCSPCAAATRTVERRALSGLRVSRRPWRIRWSYRNASYSAFTLVLISLTCSTTAMIPLSA